MKDIPIWARWNGQEVLAIHRDVQGWHTYYLRRGAHGAPMLHAADLAVRALSWAVRLCGKPWRRLTARPRAPQE